MIILRHAIYLLKVTGDVTLVGLHMLQIRICYITNVDNNSLYFDPFENYMKVEQINCFVIVMAN